MNDTSESAFGASSSSVNTSVIPSLAKRCNFHDFERVNVVSDCPLPARAALRAARSARAARRSSRVNPVGASAIASLKNAFSGACPSFAHIGARPSFVFVVESTTRASPSLVVATLAAAYATITVAANTATRRATPPSREPFEDDVMPLFPRAFVLARDSHASKVRSRRSHASKVRTRRSRNVLTPRADRVAGFARRRSRASRASFTVASSRRTRSIARASGDARARRGNQRQQCAWCDAFGVTRFV